MREQSLRQNPFNRAAAVVLAFFVVGGAFVFAIS